MGWCGKGELIIEGEGEGDIALKSEDNNATQEGDSGEGDGDGDGDSNEARISESCFTFSSRASNACCCSRTAMFSLKSLHTPTQSEHKSTAHTNTK